MQDVLAGQARWAVVCADARSELAGMADASVDAVVTDPPAGIAFMGKEWDKPDSFPLRERGPLRGVLSNPQQTAHAHERGFANGMHIDSGKRARDTFIAGLAAVFTECRRVIKPGGYALVWALPRTSHWTATALEDADWTIRDSVHHIQGAGFPKSKSCLKPAHEVWWLAKAPGPLQPLQIDAARVATSAPDAAAMEPCNTSNSGRFYAHRAGFGAMGRSQPGVALDTSAGRWPPNTLFSHVGGPDGCQPAGVRRVRGNGDPARFQKTSGGWASAPYYGNQVAGSYADADGYETVDAWTCHPQCPIRLLDEQAGPRTSGGRTQTAGSTRPGLRGNTIVRPADHVVAPSPGNASRFFPTFGPDPDPEDAVPFRYEPKASRAERDHGLEALPQTRGGAEQYDSRWKEGTGELRQPLVRNGHPTVKPLNLMCWLVKLVARPGNLILDPFCGSGSTGVACVREGMGFIGIDAEPSYVEIARARIAHEQERQAGPLFAGIAAQR